MDTQPSSKNAALKNCESLWISPFGLLKELLAFCYRDSSKGFGPHITRYAYLTLISSFIKRNSELNNREFKNVLDVSGSTNLGVITGLKFKKESITSIQYPDCAFPNTGLKSNEFDLILSDQVLEHIDGSPWEVANETERLLKPNGYAIITTCFMNPYHPFPGDYLRFSAEGLRSIFKSNNLEIVNIGEWGNRLVWIICELGFRFTPVPHNPSNPVHKVACFNEKGVAIVTWIIVKKLK